MNYNRPVCVGDEGNCSVAVQACGLGPPTPILCGGGGPGHSLAACSQPFGQSAQPNIFCSDLKEGVKEEMNGRWKCQE